MPQDPLAVIEMKRVLYSVIEIITLSIPTYYKLLVVNSGQKKFLDHRHRVPLMNITGFYVFCGVTKPKFKLTKISTTDLSVLVSECNIMYKS